MNPKCKGCPISGECKSYAVLCRNHEKNPNRWRSIVFKHNNYSPEYPSLINQVGNYIGSTVEFVKDKCKRPDKEEIDRRMEICIKCEMYDQIKRKCIACGCPIKKKISRASSQCPLGKWGNDGGV